MNTDKRTKINQLLHSQPKGTVLLASWLTEQGYSLDLLKSYRRTNWLQSLGSGAMIRKDDVVSYEGGLYALQKQSGLNIHIGGKTALSYLGKSHYLDLGSAKVTLFGYHGEKLPTWFKNFKWDAELEYYASSFLPPHLGLVDVDFKTFTLKISGAARAIMECLYLAPKNQALFECYELMEGLNNLRPNLVQNLLEECSSIKVKRLFLYLADKINHQWLDYVNLENIDLGSGKRSLVENGVYIPKYQITVPQELEKSGKAEL